MDMLVLFSFNSLLALNESKLFLGLLNFVLNLFVNFFSFGFYSIIIFDIQIVKKQRI